MNFPNLTTAGIQGIQQGMDNLRRDAQSIASSSAKGNENTKDLAESMVDLQVDKQQVEASVKVVQATGEVLGSLLDIKV